MSLRVDRPTMRRVKAHLLVSLAFGGKDLRGSEPMRARQTTRAVRMLVWLRRRLERKEPA